MTERKKWYPGKPGPKPTGLTRTILYPFALTDDEYEYLNRIARHSDGGDQGGVRKIAPYMRKKLFPRGWRDVMLALRKEQGANIKP